MSRFGINARRVTSTIRFYPIISQLQHTIGLKQIREPELKFEKLKNVLVGSGFSDTGRRSPLRRFAIDSGEATRHAATGHCTAAKNSADGLR